jgi:glutamine synthetase adenylyltransferase
MSDTYQSLRSSLQALALPAKKQTRLLEQQESPVANLALEFTQAYQAARKQHRAEMTVQQATILEVLSKLLVEMSSTSDRSVWSLSALKKNEKWEAVRELALSGLTAFHWPLAEPGSKMEP